MTDAGVSALSAGCGQLQRINLKCYKKVTDASVSALARGCGQLQRINLKCCKKVTDAGVSALGAGCSQLQSRDLFGYNKVTDACLISFCTKNQSLKVDRYQLVLSIDDVSVICFSER